VPVFETGALAVQPTLRCSESSVELSDELLLTIHILSFSNAAGGIRTHTKTVLETVASAVGLPRLLPESAPGRIRTCNNVTLDHAPLPSWATEASQPSMDAGGSRTLVTWLQARSPTVGRRALRLALLAQDRARSSRCEKGSNLQPRPSEGRALILLSYRNPYMVQAGFEPALT